MSLISHQVFRKSLQLNKTTHQPYKIKNENRINSTTPLKQKFPSESKNKAFIFGALSFHLKEHLKCECNKIVFKLLFNSNYLIKMLLICLIINFDELSCLFNSVIPNHHHLTELFYKLSLLKELSITC